MMTIYTPTCDDCGPLGDFANYDHAIAYLLRHVDDPRHDEREGHRGRVVPRASDRPAARGR